MSLHHGAHVAAELLLGQKIDAKADHPSVLLALQRLLSQAVVALLERMADNIVRQEVLRVLTGGSPYCPLPLGDVQHGVCQYRKALKILVAAGAAGASPYDEGQLRAMLGKPFQGNFFGICHLLAALSSTD